MNNKRNAHCVVRFLKVTMNCPSLPLTAKTNLFLTLFTVRTESTRLTHIRWQPFTFVDVLFPNNKIILLAQTLFSAQPGFLFSSAIEKKKKHTLPSLAQKFVVLHVSFLLTQATPAVKAPSRRCWYHLTRFRLINKTQRP